MPELDTLDIVVLGFILLGTAAYFTKGTYWGVPAKDPFSTALAGGNGPKTSKGFQSRNIIETMDKTHKNCVVFYGSQTGTAEDYASRLAKEGKSRFGLETMVADIEEYDYDNLDSFPSDKVAMFVVATYGEGEPTDNAIDFFDFLSAEEVTFAEKTDNPLAEFHYVAFGLGNNTYEHFNKVVRVIDQAFLKLGATRIGDAGEGDDGTGTLEEDFLAWKEPMWADLAEKFGLEEREAVYEPIFGITDLENLTKDSPEVYLGEPNKQHLDGTNKGPFHAHNPYISPISDSYELFSVKDRNCIHVNFDISQSNLTYQTGDHVAVWPTNPGDEVDRFLDILGLGDKRHQVISVKALEPTAKVPFPTPTTLDVIVRYHLEICAPVSRQFVDSLVTFAPTEDIKAEMTRLGSDKDYFHEKTGPLYHNIARLLADVSNGEKWSVPFSVFIEGLNKLQPRYYSISSSALVQPKKISITAIIENQPVPTREAPFRGVATNYLLALKQKQNGDPDPTPFGKTYEIMGPRNKYDGIHVPIHVRLSNFKLPSDPSRPIIMVGPGTGVAPFRAFIQERSRQVQDGLDVGKTLLFFGCRNSTEDFTYKEEWEEHKKIMGDKFEMVTAFSREGPKKVYVQHRLKEYAAAVNELINKKAYFYTCGDASNMARDVNATLVQIIAEGRDVPEQKAEQIVKSMRGANQYQEDVW